MKDIIVIWDNPKPKHYFFYLGTSGWSWMYPEQGIKGWGVALFTVAQITEAILDYHIQSIGSCVLLPMTIMVSFLLMTKKEKLHRTSSSCFLPSSAFVFLIPYSHKLFIGFTFNFKYYITITCTLHIWQSMGLVL